MFKIKTSKSRCGCIVSMSGGVEETIDWLFTHELSVVTEGNKRWKKVICNTTGKWWTIKMPDLKEIK